MKFYLYYLIIINITSFLFYGIDKRKAIFNKQRISERMLFLLSLFGGPIGSILGMFYFHHKTKKIKFYFLNFITLIIWIYLTYRFLLFVL